MALGAWKDKLQQCMKEDMIPEKRPDLDLSKSNRRYRAFISYNHRDRVQAQWLHSRLESYRFPKGVVDAFGVDAPTPIAPVFRDRDELRAGTSLSQSLQEALRESEALIVVCSPHSAASEWVAKEIDYFRSLGREDRIFAFIVGGNPSALLGTAQACFPPAMRVVSSSGAPTDDLLAADARPEGDGRRLALLKIIAALAQIPLDSLVQRDQRRAIRRLRLTLASASLLLLLFAGLGVALYLQGQEVRRQRDMAILVRNNAQELNSYIIGDLRERLRGVGRLDLLTGVTQRVLEYHEKMPKELGADPAVLLARAKALDYAGQIAQNQGLSKLAVQRLESSRLEWVRLLSREDLGMDALNGFAINAKMLSEAYLTAGDDEGALTACKSGLEALIGLPDAQDETRQVSQDRLLSLLWEAYGVALRRVGLMSDATSALQTAAQYGVKAADAAPRDFKNLHQAASAQSELAEQYRMLGDLDAALRQAKGAVATAHLFGDSALEDAHVLMTNSRCLGTLYTVQMARKEWPEAEQSARERLRMQQMLSERDPGNPHALAKLAIAFDDMAQVLARGGKGGEAIEPCSEALRLFGRLVETYPTRVDWRRSLAISLCRFGDLAFDTEQWDIALDSYKQSLQVRETVYEMQKGTPQAVMDLMVVQLSIGETYWKLGQLRNAEGHLAKAKEYSEKLPANFPQATEVVQSVLRAWKEFRERVNGTK